MYVADILCGLGSESLQIYNSKTRVADQRLETVILEILSFSSSYQTVGLSGDDHLVCMF